MHAVSLTARQHAGFFLLVVAAEVETADVGTRVHAALAELDELVAAADDFPDGLLRVDVGVLLVDVTDLHGLTYLEGARVGLFQAHDEAEQRGLTSTVGTDDAYDATLRQAEAEVLEQQLVAIGLGDVMRLDDFGAEAVAVGDIDLEFLLFLFHVFVEHLLIRLQTGFALGVTCFRGHAYPFQLTFEGFAALALGLLFHGKTGGLLVEPRRVVALPRNAFATVEFEDPASHMVEEVTVVGDGDDGAFILLQVALQPLNAFSIEVVGWLVEEQDVRLLQEEPAESHTATLTS